MPSFVFAVEVVVLVFMIPLFVVLLIFTKFQLLFDISYILWSDGSVTKDISMKFECNYNITVSINAKIKLCYIHNDKSYASINYFTILVPIFILRRYRIIKSLTVEHFWIGYEYLLQTGYYGLLSNVR